MSPKRYGKYIYLLFLLTNIHFNFLFRFIQLLFAGIEPTGTMFQTINNLLLQHQFRGESVNVSEELRVGECFYNQSNLYSHYT